MATADVVYTILIFGENLVKQHVGLKIKMDGGTFRLLKSENGEMKGTGYLKENSMQDEVANFRSIVVYEQLFMKEDSGMIYFWTSLNDY